MHLRHEWKHRLVPEDLPVLRQRLRLIAKPDPYDAIGSAASISTPPATRPCGRSWTG